MEINIDIRKRQLQSLEDYIASTSNKIQHVLNALKWTQKDVLKSQEVVVCECNANHRIAAKTAHVHLAKCRLKALGYESGEQLLSEPQENIKNSIIIDDRKKGEIIASAKHKDWQMQTGWNGQEGTPITADRLCTTFTTDERLALYNYTVKHTEKPPKLPDYNILYQKNAEDRPLTREEKSKLERDAKRRRIKYKSVHTNHKNYVEILRELIDNEMDMYNDWLLGKETTNADSEDSRDSRKPTDRPRTGSSVRSSSKHNCHEEEAVKSRHQNNNRREEGEKGRHRSSSEDVRRPRRNNGDYHEHKSGRREERRGGYRHEEERRSDYRRRSRRRSPEPVDSRRRKHESGSNSSSRNGSDYRDYRERRRKSRERKSPDNNDHKYHRSKRERSSRSSDRRRESQKRSRNSSPKRASKERENEKKSKNFYYNNETKEIPICIYKVTAPN